MRNAGVHLEIRDQQDLTYKGTQNNWKKKKKRKKKEFLFSRNFAFY